MNIKGFRLPQRDRALLQQRDRVLFKQRDLALSIRRSCALLLLCVFGSQPAVYAATPTEPLQNPETAETPETAPEVSEAAPEESTERSVVYSLRDYEKNPAPVREYENDYAGLDGVQRSLEGPDVVITAGTKRTVYEYRQNGQLRLVKIVPSIGRPYYLVPADPTRGFGDLGQASTLLPQWTIIEF